MNQIYLQITNNFKIHIILDKTDKQKFKMTRKIKYQIIYSQINKNMEIIR